MSPVPLPDRTELTRQAEEAKVSAMSFADGFRCLFKGMRFVYVDHRELARFYVPPMLLAVVFLVGGFVLFTLHADDLVRLIWSEPDPEAWWGVQHFFWKALAVIAWLVLALATAILTALLFTLFAAPFSDFISERTEGILGTWDPRPFSFAFMISDLKQTLKFEGFRLVLKLAWLIPLFVASLLIPIVGQLVYVVVGGYILAKYTGMDYVDWCAARRGWAWKERMAFARLHRYPLLGLGASVVVSLMIPLAFVFVWPAAVAGGAILFTALVGEKEKP